MLSLKEKSSDRRTFLRICVLRAYRVKRTLTNMPPYSQNQHREPSDTPRHKNEGSVKLARERAEVLSRREISETPRPLDSRWAATRDDGRDYTPRETTRTMYNGPPQRTMQPMRPPPAVWKTTPYSSAPVSPVSSIDDFTATPKAQRDRGEMTQNFRFPQVPMSTTSSPQRLGRNRNQQAWQQAPHEQHLNSPARSLPKPNRAQAAVVQPAAEQRNALGMNPTRLANPYEGQSVYSRPSEPRTPPAHHGIVRQASLGKRGKPTLTSIRTLEMREDYAGPKSPRANTIDALSAAVTAGMASSPGQQTSRSLAKSSIRMPFADDSPPSSPLQPPQVFEGSPGSGNSRHSSNPLLGVDHRPGMSDRIPSSRRPPRLNIEAVREAEGRGSTTSLAELIRRATKLASNLDRGKTASTLGMLDMFNASEKGARASGSISDMLSAFPEPGTTPTSANGGRYPPGSSHLRNAELVSRDSESEKPARSCCGMSLTAFIIAILILIILIAAAVIIPIFLIVIPRTKNASTGLAHCSTSHPCQNMGISVVRNNTCSCVCTNGYTGDHCQLGIDAECITTDVTIEGKNYNSATAGNLIPAILTGASQNFSITLNSTALLSLFATNNLSCITENSLINFNVQTQNQKRFLPIDPQQRTDLEIVSTTIKPAPTDRPMIADLNPRAPQSSTIASINGIVFQTSTMTSATPSAASSTSSSPSSSTSSITPVSAKTLSFAQVVVLYVFEQSNTLSIAVNAQQTMQSYLANVGGDANGTLSVGYKDLQLSADFARFEVLWANGSTVGGVQNRRWVEIEDGT